MGYFTTGFQCINDQFQNTGGFFVAVLEKTAPCPWENKKKYESEAAEEAEGESGETAKNGDQNGEGKKRKADDGGGGQGCNSIDIYSGVGGVL